MHSQLNLYVLDTGVVTSLTSAVRTSPPKVVIINTVNRKVIKTIDLSRVAGWNSHLDKLVVETPLVGKPFIYMSDAHNNRILVWDVGNHHGWAVQLPQRVTEGYEQHGSTFYGYDEQPQALYLALGRTKSKGVDRLYFTHFYSQKLYSVCTSFLQRNAKISSGIVEVGDKPEGMVILGTDKESRIYLRHGCKSPIYRWDPLTAFKEHNFELVSEGDEYRMATAVAPGFTGVMFGLDSNFEDFLLNTTNCLGPTVSLFPLVKPCLEKSKKCAVCTCKKNKKCFLY